jgi:site-specific recombinase XerD
MTTFAPLLQAFFSERLLDQRRASPHTIAAYRDTFRLLLEFAQRRLRKAPTQLDLQDLDAAFVADFLADLEVHRRCSIRTRNARLAAVHSFFRYTALKEPTHAGAIQRILAIPTKRFEQAVIPFLSRAEIDALLAAPDRSTWLGRRDHALLLTALQTGMRVSELTQVRIEDLQLGVGAHVRCHGKGRKERCSPLTAQCAAVLRAWLRERDAKPAEPLFPSRAGAELSRDSVEHLLEKAGRRARQICPSLRAKRLSPHVLRHTCAMQLLQAGVDRSVIALWLGHESVETTQIYLHADLALKERALALTAQPRTRAGRYRAPDSLLAFLEGL